MNYFFKKRFHLVFSVFVLATFTFGSIFPKRYKNHLSDAWYPVKGKLLIRKLEELQIIAQEKYQASLNPSFVRALICPHAGYDYSGAVASSAYNLLHPGIFKRVIILAPFHQNDFSGASLPGVDYDSYKNPLDRVALDIDMIKKLKKSSPLFIHNQWAHEHDHSIEVQIPFIQTYCGDCKIVPILIGSVTDDEIKSIAEALRPFLDEKTLLVVSSDFTHYGKQFGYTPFKQSITQNIFQLDSALVEKIQEFDLSGFSQVLQKTQATVCGKSAIMILLNLIEQKAFGDIASYVVGYDTSASDKKNPDHSVSYVSMVFTKEQKAGLHKNIWR